MSDKNTLNGPTRYETLFGGTTVTVEVADHQKREVIDRQVKIRQVKIAEYNKVFAVHDNDLELIRLLTDLLEHEINEMSQGGLMLLSSEIRRINADFFAWCLPKWEKLQSALNQLPPDQVAKVIELGKSRSENTSPNSLRRPVSVAGSP